MKRYLGKRYSNFVFLSIFYLLSCDLLRLNLLVMIQLRGASGEKKIDLHIGGMFPINGTGGWQGGQACEPAAQMALYDVNKNTDLLTGYTLKLHWYDSECEPGRGAAVMYQLLYNDPVKVLLLVGCSAVCTTVAETARNWNMIVMCYGASSPALSNRNRFETLFRTHPSATVHNPTRIKLMQKFGWSRIGILQQAEEEFISTLDDLEERCNEAGIEIVTRQSFLTHPRDAVRNLLRQDARIVVGLFYVAAARRVLCEIYKQNLFGRAYVWMFLGRYEDDWYEVELEQEGIDCTREEMKMAAKGHLTTEAVMWGQGNEKTISGQTVWEFRTRLNVMLKDKGYDIDSGRYPEGYQEAPLAYDAVWALALAFNKTIGKLAAKGKKLEEFSYTNRPIRDEIYKALNTISFLGVSGRTAFSLAGDRIALTQVEQMRDGKYYLLGYYDTENDNLTWYNNEQWIGGRVPQDRTIIRVVLRKVSSSLFIPIGTIAGVGIVWAIVLILFTYIYRDRKVIKLSHPVTNTLMLIGHAICLISVFLLGLDGQLSKELFTFMCTLKTWVLSIGFTLGYGAMFSKVWRIHRLTTKNKSVTKHKIQPWKLYLLVATLVGIEVIYLTTWTLADPLQRVVEIFPFEIPHNSEEDSKIQPQLEHCESSHDIWLGITYSFKGLLLMFGVFLAYETRSLKVRHINDSRLVAMSIYNETVLCLITTPVTMIISSQQDASFAFVGLAIIFSSFVTMGLVYIPKVVKVIREGKQKSDQSSDPDPGTTNEEEEERYHKLLSENEQLQKILEQKEVRLRKLREKLKERNAIKKLEVGATVDSVGEELTLAESSTYYTEPSDSAIGRTLSHTCSTMIESESESYL